MADIKAAFFDLDGTVISFETHEIVPSAREALRLLRANGIHPIMATGRAPFQVAGVDWDDFDAYMTYNGNYCFTKEGDVIRSCSLSRETIEAVYEDVERQRYAVMYMMADEVFVTERTQKVRDLEERVSMEFPLRSQEGVLDREVFQLNLFIGPDEEDLVAHVPNLDLVRWTPLMADGVAAGSGKQAGVEAMLDYFGLTPEEAIAFGDGGNDVPMFRACGMSVCMANGMDEAKAAATYLTDSVDDDGVLNACRKLGLV